MTDSRRTVRRAIAGAGILVLWGTLPGLAQGGGDFGGSFDPGVAAVTPVQPPPTAAASDFGGSFGDGGGVPTPPVVAGAEPAPAPQPGGEVAPVVGGGDFDTGGGVFDPPVAGGGAGGGSFDPPAGGGIVVAPAPPKPAPPASASQAPQIDPQIAAFEQRDFGVAPTGNLRSGQVDGPTPTVVPGSKTIGTNELAQAMNAGVRIVLIDVLGAPYSLPGALMAPAMASPGSFDDQIQQQTVQWLGQLSAGDPNISIVIYCSSPECWLSYNAVLRAVAAGYMNVYWYRGGSDAWQMAGLPLQPAGF